MIESENAQDEAAKADDVQMERPSAENEGAETQADAGGLAEEVSDADKIAALEKENAELKDQLLRRAADFDNYRKRMIREKQETAEYANSNLLSDLLESLDNFDRTVEAADKAADAKSIADGVKMISTNLVKMLEDKYNLVGYGKPGDLFNPDEHQAIGSEEGDVSEPVLKEVYLKGYKLKEKIIRHAKVMVSMPASPGEQ